MHHILVLELINMGPTFIPFLPNTSDQQVKVIFTMSADCSLMDGDMVEQIHNAVPLEISKE